VLEEEPAEPPEPDAGGGPPPEHEHVLSSKLPPAGHGLGAQFLQPAVASTATAKTAQSHRNPLMPFLKAFMRSSLVHRSAWGSPLK
jgi:hypothetical protein